MVNSHSCSNAGLFQYNGTSVVLHFACLDNLHHYILADSLSPREKLFELCGISVSKGARVKLLGVPCRNERIGDDGNYFFGAISQAVSGS